MNRKNKKVKFTAKIHGFQTEKLLIETRMRYFIKKMSKTNF